MSRSALSLLIVGVLLLLAAPAMAAPARWQALDRVPHALPGTGARAASASQWIVGARAGAATRALAARHGATAVHGLAGAYGVPTGRARAFATALRRRGLLRFSEPDRMLRRTSSFETPDGPTPWARGSVIPAGLTPPANPAKIGIVDDLVDAAVPDVAQAKVVKGTATHAILDGHGTAVASVAAGKADGAGVIGITPGAPILTWGLKKSSCLEVAQGILDVSLAGAKVLNLSLGTTEDCWLLELAVADAFANGTLVVAASGNEFESGNPIVYPAAYPHVVSVGAIDVFKQPTYFSSANAALDLAAPGDDVPVAVPTQYDRDGTVDGISQEDGTSFASPIVAGVASWLMAARPNLEPGQYADLLRRSATDIGDPGWDASTGFGLVNLQGALAAATPRIDPLEPNDGISYVDGNGNGTPSPYIWTGGLARTIHASVDAVEDPVDVYRIRLRAHERAKITLTPSAGNADLRLYDGSVKRLQGKVLARSTHGGTATDTVRPTNARSKARTYYVAVVAPSVKSRAFDAQYHLKISRR